VSVVNLRGDSGDQYPRTWKPVDLEAILDGSWERPQPTVGYRDDGEGLFYPGRCHLVAAEAEAGKSWLALHAVAQELARGNACVYLDFEDDEGGIAGRLLTMGALPDAIRKRFAYIHPENPVFGVGSDDLTQVLFELAPTLVVLDGVTEAMSLHDLELKDNSDVAKFSRILTRPLSQHGAAVVMLDHVVKDREARGGHAIGGVHKLNGLNGAMYVLENREQFGIGRRGRSSLKIRKDRPGQLRRTAVPVGEGLFWYADLVIQSHGPEFAEVSLAAAAEREAGAFRPTVIMSRICKTLAANPEGLSGRAVEGLVTGDSGTKRAALEMLVNEGYVTAEISGRAKIHKLARAFDED